MALQLEAGTGTTTAVPSEDGSLALTIEPPADVLLTVTAPESTEASAVKVSKDGTEVQVTFTAGTATDGTVPLTGTLTGVTEDDLGTYTVTDGTDTATLDIKASATEPPVEGEDEPDAALEVAPGVYDREFAMRSGAVAAGLAVAVLVLSFASIGRFGLEAELTTVTQGWVTNTLAERVAGVVQLTALAVGAALLVVGAWLAALEVRGRLSAVVAADPDLGDRGVGAEVGEAAAAVIDVLRKARGTIAVLAIGAIVVLGSLWSAAHVASSSHGPRPAPSPTVSTGSGASPSLPGSTNSTPSPTVTGASPAPSGT